MYAVITVGGRQYRVTEGDRILVDRLSAPVGDTVRLDSVAFVAGDGVRQVGTPRVDGAVVEARVLEHVRGKKLQVFKYRPKKRFRSRTGFRADLTALRVASIGRPAAASLSGGDERGVAEGEGGGQAKVGPAPGRGRTAKGKAVAPAKDSVEPAAPQSRPRATRKKTTAEE